MAAFIPPIACISFNAMPALHRLVFLYVVRRVLHSTATNREFRLSLCDGRLLCSQALLFCVRDLVVGGYTVVNGDYELDILRI